MRVSAEGQRFIESWEGYMGRPYRCPAGVLTIGYGHTENVQAGQFVTKEQASELLRQDLDSKYGAEVSRLIGNAYTDQQEFDALASLAFNIGLGAFTGSTALRLHKAGDKQGAARALQWWTKATIGGVLQDVPGLVRRRAAEAALYLTPDEVAAKVAAEQPRYLPEQVGPTEIPQAVAPPPSAAASKTAIAGGVATASAAVSAASQIEQITPIINSVTTAGASVQNLLRLGGVVVAVIAVAAAGFVLWRYLSKRRKGEVIST